MNEASRFDWPRELYFYNESYKLGSSGYETPFIKGNKTYLYVQRVSDNGGEYYCWETDAFTAENEFNKTF